ncbi:GNAT family N-acetyltransferase [Paenibacillus radicis (ex Gao et al. 2016)]|uniref:N-acetyltransferase n=1 Tax=Paenibacillus radicis (ex Gao et al. 2016) TaxID=1737354 RepID=A0A917H1U3_9BACL|nr:GNAT family N-acetyltransferase [Paenibacillus radicis (ex Gao et al. 2016)]GGG65258.1 N-acetyltransferase [Paenibacillus radicis (ex Gao et al. 2016)]
MIIEAAIMADYAYILERDKHLLQHLIESKIDAKEIYMLHSEEGNSFGWLRYGYFWDNTPFMNMLWIDDAFRGKGLGKQAVLFWEEDMKRKGFKLVMTSTLANEEAQHFYRKLGYKDAGCLLLENEPLEIILTKNIS